MSDTTKAPHCPRCGGEMVQKIGVIEQWIAFCDSCGFGDPQLLDVTEDETVVRYARRLVRAELARQALEMRAHAQATESENFGAFDLPGMTKVVMDNYVWLGTHPLRLPGEEA